MGFGAGQGNNYPFTYTFNFNSPTSVTPYVLPNGQTATMENALGAYSVSDPKVVNGRGLSLLGREYDYKSAYTQSFNGTFQYQVSHPDSIQVAYVGVLGRHLDSSIPQNSTTQILPPGTSIYGYIPFPDFAPNPAFITTRGISTYNSGRVTYEHTFNSGFSMLANYTRSACRTDAQAYNDSGPGYRAPNLPGWGIRKDYSLCASDSTHVLHASGTYQLPFGQGHRWAAKANRVVESVIGGWTVNYIYTFQSGNPFSVGCPVATTANFGCYANINRGVNPYAGPHNVSQWLNPAAFSQPAAATAVGQSDYSVLGGDPQQVRGPSFHNIDFSLFKNFRINETTKLQFRGEAFNATNTAQFGMPGQLNWNNSVNFSAITSLRNTARRLQFALKLYF